jgi:hypothetical protein
VITPSLPVPALTGPARHRTRVVPFTRRPSAGAVEDLDSARFSPSPSRGDIPAGALGSEVDG